ncbi:MAG: ATP-binding protein [Ghiorsea sp.]
MNIADSVNFGLENKASRANIFLKALIIVIASYGLFGLATYYFYQQEEAKAIERFQLEGVTNTAHHKQIISHEFKLILQNLRYLKEQAQFHDVFDEKVGTKDTEDDLLVYMKSSSVLDQVRLIDNSGQEIIRINKMGNVTEVVSKGRLQKKTARYYMHEIIKLNQGEIYISALDLNKEFGKVEIPFKPVIRLGMGVFDPAGHRKGSLIINYSAAELLNILRQSGLSLSGDMLLLNENGYYLSAPNKDKAWGFMFEDKGSLTLASEANEVWQEMMARDKGRIVSGDNLYVFLSVYPYQEMNVTDLPKRDFKAKQCWKIISYYGESHIEEVMKGYRKLMIQWAYIFGFAVFLISWPLSFLLERRRLLNEHVTLLSNAVEYMGESVCVTTPKGLIEYINPSFANLTGYTMAEAVGKRPADLLKSTAQSGSFYKEMWQTIKQGEVWQGKLVDRRKDGSFFPSTMSISPVQNAKGIITHYISIQSDDTTSKLMIDKELREEKMKTLAVAVGGIAHEFNNILAGILGNTFLMKMKGNGNKEIVAKLERIEGLGKSAAHMVRQMMIYVGNDIHALVIEDIDTNLLCKEAVSIAERQYDMIFKLNLCVEDVVLAGDIARLSEALSNLLSNAAEAVSDLDDGLVMIDIHKVTIEASIAERFAVSPSQSYVCIEVQDNGKGILKEHQEIIFEPFFTTKDVGKGTGLGLSAVYGIAKDHHGFIQLDYERKQGCNFKLYLPLKQKPFYDI